ncbi:hypothetical protein RchiOBHm_Chr4g0421101 [Rosa chinensis]|uniref:Uncharacterized protein n=1 Tax=Rosa chinensis TaxID=74649 RepID=A0A2P6QXZ9_ROSCH|nr:hypothetical protein RchiOBHm_Chr4g0421101 [Rosa chinensis]
MMPEEVVEMGLQEHDVVVVTSFSLLQALDIVVKEMEDVVVEMEVLEVEMVVFVVEMVVSSLERKMDLR